MLFYFILPSQRVTLLLIPYHFIISPVSQNSIFIKILFFNFFILFLSNRHFFSDLVFLGFPIVIFFPLFLPQPLAPVQHTKSHTHKNPWYTDQPIQTHHRTYRATHTYKHKPSNLQQSHTHKNHQNSWSQQRPPHPPPKPPISKPKPPISKSTPPIWNPGHRK